MNSFENIIGRKILAIHRLDNQVDYEMYSPYAIILALDEQSEKLLITTMNDGSSVDIRMTTDKQIAFDYGLEFGEHFLNRLREGDELKELLENKIEKIKIAELKSSEIKGNDFVIHQSRYAGIELITNKNKLLFKNNYGGWYDFDENLAEISNKERWEWR